MTFQSMLQVSLNHGDNEGVMFALPAQRLPETHAWRRPPPSPNLGSRCPVKATFVFKHVGLRFFKPRIKPCQKSRFGKFCWLTAHTRL